MLNIIRFLYSRKIQRERINILKEQIIETQPHSGTLKNTHLQREAARVIANLLSFELRRRQKSLLGWLQDKSASLTRLHFKLRWIAALLSIEKS